ncbi:MAG: dihydrodipicolinate synthase family protein [Blastocatellia bacterium]|nr:dihydrodipicolinate synthase family protein [Blastocatellia bacterium]
MLNEKLTGIIVPLLTPLHPDETLDETGLRRLIEYVLAAGASGVLALGTTGEFPLLTNAVKQRVAASICEIVAGRVPVLLGISDAGTQRALQWGRTAAAYGADAVVSTVPYYFTHTQEELLTHFTTLAESLPLPLFAYNIPQRARTSLAASTVQQLAEHPNIAGVKDSSGDWELFQGLLQLRTETFCVLQGSERLAGISALHGADGFVLGPANLAPDLCRALWEAGRRGDTATQAQLQAQLDELCSIYQYKSGLAAMKAALHTLGLSAQTVCAPFATLNEAELAQVCQTLSRLGLRREVAETA